MSSHPNHEDVKGKTMRTMIAGCIAIHALATVAVGEATMPSPTSADAAAIKQTALDYVEGWYEADAQIVNVLWQMKPQQNRQ
jgi:hypothetical protein